MGKEIQIVGQDNRPIIKGTYDIPASLFVRENKLWAKYTDPETLETIETDVFDGAGNILPTPTIEDAGKVLGVNENGEYALMSNDTGFKHFIELASADMSTGKYYNLRTGEEITGEADPKVEACFMIQQAGDIQVNGVAIRFGNAYMTTNDNAIVMDGKMLLYARVGDKVQGIALKASEAQSVCEQDQIDGPHVVSDLVTDFEIEVLEETKTTDHTSTTIYHPIKIKFSYNLVSD